MATILKISFLIMVISSPLHAAVFYKDIEKKEVIYMFKRQGIWVNQACIKQLRSCLNSLKTVDTNKTDLCEKRSGQKISLYTGLGSEIKFCKIKNQFIFNYKDLSYRLN